MKSAPTIGSLFSGLGCLDRAVEIVTRGRTIWQVEQVTYRRTVGSKEGLDGKKSGLWREYRRIVEACKPGAVFIENVARLRIRGLDRVLQDLANLGYDAVWTTTRGSDVGLYFGRPRVFLLACTESYRLQGNAPTWLRQSPIRGIHDADGCDASLARSTDGQGSQDYNGPEPGLHRAALGSSRGVVARQRAARVAALGDTVSIPQAVAAYAWCVEQYQQHALTDIPQSAERA